MSRAKKKTVSKKRALRVPKLVTRDRFLVWRSPRIGNRNPHELTNPSWAWLAQNPELSAYGANAHFAGPSSMEVGPAWCAMRFGQSRTELADGRVIAIGGEHEDYYDPDFFIYNDVIVTQDGDVRIYCYPAEVFAPTDFHSATLVGDRIVIVGRLGYAGTRQPGVTPIYLLDTTTYRIEAQPTSGTGPGWIFRHEAELDDGRLLIRGGERVEGDEHRIVESVDDWALDLEHCSWTRLTDRRWQQWSLVRADGRSNDLFEISTMRWYRDGKTPYDRKQLARMVRERGAAPDFDLFDARFVPAIDHERLAIGDGYPLVVRIAVDGVTVRYVEDSREVAIVVEGALDQAKIDLVVEDARAKLERLEQCAYSAQCKS